MLTRRGCPGKTPHSHSSQPSTSLSFQPHTLLSLLSFKHNIQPEGISFKVRLLSKNTTSQTAQVAVRTRSFFRQGHSPRKIARQTRLIFRPKYSPVNICHTRFSLSERRSEARKTNEAPLANTRAMQTTTSTSEAHTKGSATHQLVVSTNALTEPEKATKRVQLRVTIPVKHFIFIRKVVYEESIIPQKVGKISRRAISRVRITYYNLHECTGSDILQQERDRCHERQLELSPGGIVIARQSEDLIEVFEKDDYDVCYLLCLGVTGRPWPDLSFSSLFPFSTSLSTLPLFPLRCLVLSLSYTAYSS